MSWRPMETTTTLDLGATIIGCTRVEISDLYEAGCIARADPEHGVTVVSLEDLIFIAFCRENPDIAMDLKAVAAKSIRHRLRCGNSRHDWIFRHSCVHGGRIAMIDLTDLAECLGDAIDSRSADIYLRRQPLTRIEFRSLSG